MTQSMLINSIKGGMWNNQINSHSDLYEMNIYDKGHSKSIKKQKREPIEFENESVHVNGLPDTSSIENTEGSQAIIFNDRGSLESALKDALYLCAYNKDYLEISFDFETTKKNRRHRLEALYLSGLPMQVWDEIELDQEINTIEEEIARIQAEKLSLKRYVPIDSSFESENQTSSSEEELDGSFECNEELEIEVDVKLRKNIILDSSDEEEYLPPSVMIIKHEDFSSSQKTSSKSNNSSSKKDLKRKRSSFENKKENKQTFILNPSKSKIKQEKIGKSKQKKPSKKDLDYELQLSISQSNFDSNSSSPSSSSSSSSSSSKMTRKKKIENVFQVEEVLTIKPMIGTEDEDIDILN